MRLGLTCGGAPSRLSLKAPGHRLRSNSTLKGRGGMSTQVTGQGHTRIGLCAAGFVWLILTRLGCQKKRLAWVTWGSALISGAKNTRCSVGTHPTKELSYLGFFIEYCRSSPKRRVAPGELETPAVIDTPLRHSQVMPVLWRTSTGQGQSQLLAHCYSRTSTPPNA